MTTGTEVTMVRCRNGEISMILRDRRDSLLMGPNLEFDRRDTLVSHSRKELADGGDFQFLSELLYEFQHGLALH